MMNIRKLTDIFMRPVTRHPGLFVFSVLMSNIICWTALAKGVFLSPFLSFLLPVFDCYVFCLLALLLSKIRLQIIVWVGVVALMLGEMFTVCYCHATINLNIVRLVMETDARESGELLVSAFHSRDFWLPAAITAFTGVVSFFISRIRIPDERLKTVIMSGTAVMVLWSSTRQIPGYVKLTGCYMSHSISWCANEDHFPQLHGPAVRLAYGLIWNVISAEELTLLEKSVDSIGIDSCSFRCPLIVMIIGESYNKHHSPLYCPGYPLTTPYMMKRRESGSLIPYTDVVSKYNLTHEVFRSIFSTWDEDDADSWTDHTLLTALFRKAGYEVHLLSNQYVVKSDDIWDIFGGTIFNTRNLSSAQFTSRNDTRYRYDGELLGEMPSLEEMTSHPTLLIVHLLGQHVDYAERYPASFNKFSPSSSSASFGGQAGKKMIAEYDNATLYNDWVVEQIVSRFDSTDAVCLYFADHGEEVFDWRDKYERSQEAVITPEIARFQYEVPMMFFVNDTFRTNHPDIVGRVKCGADKPLISSDISNILLYLGGIGTGEYKSRRNILSPDYMPRRRLLQGTQDYDELSLH